MNNNYIYSIIEEIFKKGEWQFCFEEKGFVLFLNDKKLINAEVIDTVLFISFQANAEIDGRKFTLWWTPEFQEKTFHVAASFFGWRIQNIRVGVRTRVITINERGFRDL